jgi:hypothetical protein
LDHYFIYNPFSGHCPADIFLLLHEKDNLFLRYDERKTSIFYCIDRLTITPEFVSSLLPEIPNMSPQDRLVMYNLIARYGDLTEAELYFPDRINEFYSIRFSEIHDL